MKKKRKSFLKSVCKHWLIDEKNPVEMQGRGEYVFEHNRCDRTSKRDTMFFIVTGRGSII